MPAHPQTAAMRVECEQFVSTAFSKTFSNDL